MEPNHQVLDFLFYLLALIVTAPYLCGATEYYVRSTEFISTSCPAQPCLTFSQYINDAGTFFKSNTVFRFLSGTHEVNASVIVSNVHNISLLAEEGRNQPQVISYCPSLCSSNFNSGVCPDTTISFCLISVMNATNITIAGLSIVVHPQSALDIEVWMMGFGLGFTNISSLQLKYNRVMISHGSWSCSINVLESQYIEMNSLIITHGEIHLTDSGNIYITNVTALSCNHCINMYFTNNTVIYNSMIMSAETGIQMVGTNYTTISSTSVENVTDSAIDARNTLITTISNTAIRSVGKCSVYLYECENVTIENVVTSGAEKGVFLKFTNYTRIKKTRVLHCKHSGIVMMVTKNAEISNSAVLDPGIEGIYLGVSTSTTIINTTITDARQRGIMLQYGRNIKIENTVLMHNQIYVSSTIGMAIYNVNVMYCDIGFVLYESAAVTLSNVTAVNCTKCIIYMQHVTSIIMTNIALTPGEAHRVKVGIKISDSSNISINASVFKLFSTRLHLTITDIVRQPAAVNLHNCSNVNIRNCTFLANNMTALKLVRTHIRVIGVLNFTGNRAYRGAAMVLIHDSSMTLTKTGHVTYTNNSAEDTGGAIYIATEYSYPLEGSIFQVYSEFEPDIIAIRKCFLELGGKKNQLTFTNNSAGLGGDVLYGGSMGSSCLHRLGKCGSCLKYFNRMSVIEPDTISSISSNPSRVCFCSDAGELEYLTVFYPTTHSIYPGQTVAISMAVIGHNLGTVAGSVFAHLQHTVQLEVGQYIQEVKQHHCTKLNYTIFSQGKELSTMLTLTAVKRDVRNTQYMQEDIDYLIEGYKTGMTQNIQDILDLPIYVKINLLSCPPGFELTHTPSQCGCKKHLQLLPDVKCSIQYLTIQRRGLVWVGPLTDDNGTVIDVMSAQNCPLNYCNNQVLSITLNQSDTQCNYNHSGTLCGGCQSGLSLALGSAQCLKCSNEYLALLIPLVLAGLVLVFFIKVLDLTISQGLISGLIFYANIVKPNEHIFLPQMNTNPLTLFIAWLNLDLGIETCFVDGLTAYWKTWLQFVFPFYIWAIAGLIIISARHSTRLARMMGNNSVPVLATLFLLSYAKLLRTIITIMSYSVVDIPHGQKTVWSADGNIDYLGPQHTPLFVAATATLLFLWLPYTLLLLLGQWLHKIDHRYITHMLMKMKPFLDAHYGPLKDKHHYWFGVMLCVRVIILLISAVVPSNNFGIFTMSLSTAAGALISFTSIGPAVYHNTATSIFEISLFINLGMLGLTKFYTYTAGGNQAAATYTLIGVAFIQFLGLVSYQIYYLLKPLFSHCHTHHDDDEAAENIWRYDTSMELSMSKWKAPYTDTPYQDAAANL